MSVSPKFQKNEAVVLRSTQEMGQVEADPVLDGGEYWYRIRFVKRVESIVEEDLESPGAPDETIDGLAIEGRWGRLRAFRTALTIARIESANRSTVYAYKSQRILFEPYQYKPLLKLLDSPDRRLLIADEVGLGKTIEAGLILTELQARRPLDRILVVCPSRLRDKWREELNRKFDQDFDILTRATLDQYIERVRENPRRGQLRGIVSMQTLRNAELRNAFVAEVGQLDMVIVDEAHHARNPTTQTSEMIRDLGGMADCLLLLTATPLHLGSRDLFTLLNALRPTEFRDARVFDRQLRHYAGVHTASSLVRSMNLETLPEARELLERTFLQDVRENLRNPLAVQVIDDLVNHPPRERREWVDLERRIQELHPLGTIVTRTRKRDVQENAPSRKANVLECQWTDDEDRLYQRLVAGSTRGGWIRERLSLGQVQRARQAASCLPAAVEYARQRAATSDDEAIELTDILPGDLDDREDGSLSLDEFSPSIEDSKYDQLREVLKLIWKEEPYAKVLIFTFFVGTSTYLRERLQSDGIPTLRIAGDVPSNPHSPDHDERGKRMRAFREDPSFRVMVSTEVGSEGLDFQFCHHLVNYDLPWNPMVVEQRIGRIDRFGQKSEVISIHNLVVKGTVEEQILLRLYDRIEIFQQSIGDLESILGETISELQRDYISGRLSPEVAEARVDQAASAILRRRQELENLEKAAGDLFGHEEYIRDEMMRVGRLGRYVSEQSLIALITSYLESDHPSVRLWDEGDGIQGLRLTPELRNSIRRAAIGGVAWVDRSQDDRLLITTRGDLAFHRPEVELINSSHPLVRAAITALKDRLASPTALVGQGRLVLTNGQDDDLDAGLYFIVVHAHIVEGIRARRVLEPVVWSQASGRVLDEEAGERLLHLILEQAAEWDRPESMPPMPAEVWDSLERESRIRNRRLAANERRENAALYARRREAISQEFEHDRLVKEKRLRTAESRGHSRILPALQGQLQRAEAEYQKKLEELESTREVSVRLSDPIAICCVEVDR